MSFIKKLDPLYWVLRFLLYNRIFRALKRQIAELKAKKLDLEGQSDDIARMVEEKPEDLDKPIENVEITLADVKSNTHKQSLSIYTSIFFLYLAHQNISAMFMKGVDIMPLLVIVAPVLSGFIVAWYVITFGSIRAEFLREGLEITYFMFTTFIMCVGILGIISYYYLPFGIRLTVLAILISGSIGSFKYDMVDLLRIGIDSEGLKFYIRANEKMAADAPLFEEA